jgi:hypothetical protein
MDSSLDGCFPCRCLPWILCCTHLYASCTEPLQLCKSTSRLCFVYFEHFPQQIPSGIPGRMDVSNAVVVSNDDNVKLSDIIVPINPRTQDTTNSEKLSTFEPFSHCDLGCNVFRHVRTKNTGTTAIVYPILNFSSTSHRHPLPRHHLLDPWIS